MKLVKNLIANIVISGALLYVFNYYSIWIKISFANPEIENSIFSLVWAFLVLWFIFWVFNSPIKWILKTLSCPVNFLTLWLASIVIDVLIFYLFAYVVNTYLDGEVVVKLWEIWQTLILSFIMAISTAILTKIL
jgi:uncharacterized membrane protein YvlD (DUF360 family)